MNSQPMVLDLSCRCQRYALDPPNALLIYKLLQFLLTALICLQEGRSVARSFEEMVPGMTARCG